MIKMVKKHLKSLAAPRTWRLNRKESVFTTRPKPGAHSFSFGYSINYAVKNILKLCKITKEVKLILNKGGCLVNGKAVKDIHFIVGLMDVISFPTLKEHYRVIINAKGQVGIIKIDEKESKLVLSKIIKKTKIKGGKLQLNTMEGRNITVDKDDFKTSDSLLLEVPSYAIKESLSFEEGCTILLIGGKHIGTTGKIEKIEANNIYFNTDGKTYQTLKRFAYVLGKDKPRLKIRD